MLKEFCDYLAEQTIHFFDTVTYTDVNKYIVKLDNLEDVESVSAALEDMLKASGRLTRFVYEDSQSVSSYETFSFYLANGIRVVVVPEIDIQHAFMTRLRNIDLSSMFLFFICYNPIDSIVGGMEDLQKEGMPFHKNEILADIQKRLRKSNLKQTECGVLKTVLEQQKKKDSLDDYSLHDFENILAVIYRDKFVESDFAIFGMFSDMELIETIIVDSTSSKKRCTANYEVYKAINDSVKIGDPQTDLAGKQTEGFIKRIEQNIKTYGADDWSHGISYEDVLADQKKLTDDKNKFEYLGTTVRRNGADLIKNIEFFVRPDGDTSAKKKKLNLLVLNDTEQKESFDICVSFAAVGKKDSIESSFGCEAVFSGKSLLIRIENDSIKFARVKLKKELGYEIKICVINSTPDLFSDFRSDYTIKPKQQAIKSALEISVDKELIVLNRKAQDKNSDNTESVVLEDGLSIPYFKDKSIELVVDGNTYSDDNKVHFFLKIGDEELPVVFNCSSSINVSITGSRIEQMKLTSGESFNFYDNRLAFGTDSYNAKERLREALQTEAFMVKTRSMCCDVINAENDEFMDNPLDVPVDVREAYNRLIEYYSQRDTLPSLAYYSEELKKIASEYVDTVLQAFKSVTPGESIDKKTENVLRIGTVRTGESIAFSALHPMNIAHQLLLSNEEVGEEISEDVIKKINSDNLIPFIRNNYGSTYVCVTQESVPQWSYYYPKDKNKFNGKMGYVPRLIKEKIIHFNAHFGYLFDGIGNNTLIINAVNLGDCEQLFEGIIEYYKSEFGKNPMNIDLYVYGDANTRTAFEYMSSKTEFKKFLTDCGIKENGKQYSEVEFSNYIFDHLKYYKKSLDSDSYHYCHLAFLQMDQKEEEAFSNRDSIISGVMLDGLMAGVTSMYYGDGNATNSGKYRTGYGSKFNVHTSAVISLADYYNDLMYVFCKSGNPYNPKNCMSTFITDETSLVIDKTYAASNWVVFIDPKVDLHYFQNEKNKDVMIIHYSDQKSTSNGYDAITVTKKTEQYQNVLKAFFDTQQSAFSLSDISFGEDSVKAVIDMFNAVNGEWLLKLMSKESSFRKEKISLLAASKIMMYLLGQSEVIWVPISMEEIIRVSGAVGLSQKDGLFSAKNLGLKGAASDDLLMLGVDVSSQDNIKVYLMPVEVKIGYGDTNPVEKAKLQLKNTKDLLDKYLHNDSGSPLMAKFYRNFFVQLALGSMDKINLYNIMNIQDYEGILNSDIRGKLLNDEFELSDAFSEKIGDGIVVAFKENAIIRDVHKDENATVVKLLESDCYCALAKTDVADFVDWLDMITSLQNFKSFLLSVVSTTDNSTPLASEADTSMTETKSDSSESEADSNVLSVNDEVDVSDIPVTAADSDGIKILFGTDINYNKELYWYPNDTEKIMHPNTGIIGTMGTGKTQFTKSLIYQLVKEQNNNPGGQPLGILIFDYKGDYNKNKIDFVNATGAKVYELYHLPFNPFSIPTKGNLKPALPMHIASTFRETITKAYGLGAIQVDALKDCIMQAYSNKGIEKNDKSTWDKTAPTLNDVYNVYCESDSFKKDSLNAALSELIDFEIFEPDPTKVVSLFDFIDGVTVIDLSGYDPSVQNLIVAITLDLFYSQMQANGHSSIDGKLRQLTKFILVDEADNFLKAGFSSIRKILKEGREFGVGTIFSTQFLTHFYTSDDDYSKYIYSWIVHNVANLSLKDIKNLFNTTSKAQEEELFNLIKTLQKHHSFVKFGDSSKPYYIKDRAFWEILKDENQ